MPPLPPELSSHVQRVPTTAERPAASWRVRAAWLLGLVIVLWLGAAGPVLAANRLALVIGNNAYRDVEPLQTAVADAKAMAKALEAVGFKVNLRLDLDDRALKAAVRQFKAQLAGGDEAVFYYAGHGVQFGAENYLVPVNVGLDDEDQIKDESIPLRRVLEDLQDVKARFSLAIIDACRNNPFRSRLRSGAQRGLIPVAGATGQMVIYSAGAGQAAIDRLGQNDRDPNGVFTRVLLREIGTPGVPVDRVVRKVRDQVVALARSVGHDQVPAIYDQTIGDFYFVQGTAAVGAPAVVATAPPAAVPARAAAPAPTTPAPTPAAPTPAPAPVAVVTQSVGAAPAATVPAVTTAQPQPTPTPAPTPTPTPSVAVLAPGGPPAAGARTGPASAQAVLQALAKEQSGLKLGRALTILLEPDTPLERARISALESNLDRLRYRSALALGPTGVDGRLQLGAGQAGSLDRIAHQDALDRCGGNGSRAACRVVYTSGRLDGPALVEAMRSGIGSDLNAYRSAWRRVLAQLEKNPNFPQR
jgi:Caspase domain